MMSVISAKRLTKAFGTRLAVDDLSFDVAPGRVTGFLGPNGAGKTTTMRMLLGLAQPTSGIATVLGRSYVELEDPSRRVGTVLDASSFHPRRTARNHLRWLAAAAEVHPARVGELAAEAGVVLHELMSETQSLEDVFFELTEGEAYDARVG